MNVPQIVLDKINYQMTEPIGNGWSTSNRALVVSFEGGPADGQRALVDSPDIIQVFGSMMLRRNWEYAPANPQGVCKLDRFYDW